MLYFLLGQFGLRFVEERGRGSGCCSCRWRSLQPLEGMGKKCYVKGQFMSMFREANAKGAHLPISPEISTSLVFESCGRLMSSRLP
jgi:hypothetical protein